MKLARQSDRAFGLTFAVLFGAVAVLGRWVFEAHVVWPMVVSAAFLAAALLAPGLLLPLNRLSHPVAQGLGRVLNHLLLGAFFFLVIFPVGFGMRLFGRDTMARRFDRAAPSYFAAVGRKLGADNLRELF